MKIPVLITSVTAATGDPYQKTASPIKSLTGGERVLGGCSIGLLVLLGGQMLSRRLRCLIVVHFGAFCATQSDQGGQVRTSRAVARAGLAILATQ